ncbi:MAG: serine--tRNA ligase [Zetaproteobacteria bacterium]|nr:serine--tRNA ligase [Pseudobdellovibrionaceae bacterium]
MLDIKYIRENPDLIKKACVDKRFNADIDQLLVTDKQMQELRLELEALQNKRNTTSKAIGKAKPEEREALKAEVAAIKPKMEELNHTLHQLQETFEQYMLEVPAPQRNDVPVGKDEKDNIEIKQWGSKPSFDFKAKNHIELGEALGIIDLERGVKIAGSRSYVLKGDGARLEQAILRFSIDKLIRKGYTLMQVPMLVSEHAMVGTGYFPNGRDQAYCVEKDKMALAGTSEVPMVSYYGNEILKEAELPIRMCAQTTCYRREAGAAGRDTYGFYRVHQFQKIEQVIFAPADEDISVQLHDELLQNAEEIMQDLGLHYRVVYVCSGDLGQGQIRKHDIETWMPSRNSYGETHSCSTFHDFQARRMKIRYKDKNGKNIICYTLNNTAFASPRGMIPVIENYQQADGRIMIPEALRPYMDDQTYIG